MNKKPCLFALVTMLMAGLCLPVISCAARINGTLQTDGKAELLVSASLEPRMVALIRGLAAAGGGTVEGPILDGPAIAASMAAAPGIARVSFRNTAPAAIEGPVSISQIGDFLAPAGGSGGFISITQNAAGGRCAISLNLETGPHLLSLISPDITDFLSALMAPIATGEALSKQEYLLLAGSVYGKAVADEIAASVVRASIEFPGQIRSVKGGTFSGKRADFEIPLPDLLTLETPLEYEVSWARNQ